MPPSANLRRAAVLIASLDRDLADILLGRLSAAQARVVRQAVVELEQVDEDEREDVLVYMGRITAAAPAADDVGLELNDRLSTQLHAPSDALARFAKDVSREDADDSPFRFLHEARVDELAARLAREHPRIIAVVLAHLPPERAAELLAALAPAVQLDVVRRLSTLEQADELVVRDIEHSLRDWIEPVRGAKPVLGLAAVKSIVAAADGATQRHLQSALSKANSPLTKQIPVPPENTPAPVRVPSPKVQIAPLQRPSYAELQYYPGSQLAEVWRAADPQTGVLALAGSDAAFVDRVLDALSNEEANAICRDLDNLGPVSLAELDNAQTRIAELALRLSEPNRRAA